MATADRESPIGLRRQIRFDGCYHSFNLHDFADDDPPNFRTFVEAARAGNPAAALSFNPGQVRTIVLVPRAAGTSDLLADWRWLDYFG